MHKADENMGTGTDATPNNEPLVERLEKWAKHHPYGDCPELIDAALEAAEVIRISASMERDANLRRKGWNSAIRRAAEVAEHYAQTMKSEGAQRAADEIRAMRSEAMSAGIHR